MPPPAPKRRAVDLTPLEEHAAKVKLRSGIVLSETKKKSVSLPLEFFVQESDNYFRAIRRELQDALQEGVILIERHQVTLI
jgi:hypothetical protein